MSIGSEDLNGLKIEGSRDFREKVKQALNLIKTTGYYDFFKTYICCIKEIKGFTQLRVSEATIWANMQAIEDPIDAAGRFIQEAYYMKICAEGEEVHEGIIEFKTFEKRIEFLKKLMEISQDEEVKRGCERLIKMWDESLLIY
ncbi:hypothetical protein KEJ12_07640 [Candidatus Bathyarchaeota archaeon]|nr:hypothetical protein [Candidatus Bathyarchaeota archaeon]